VTSVAVCAWQDWTQWHSVGVAAGLFLHPDLDVDQGSITNKYIRAVPVIGDKLEWFWMKYWWLYMTLCKHRGVISHQFILGTLIRVAAAFWWLALIPGSHLYGAFVVGLVVADTGHILADMWTEFVDGFRLIRNKFRKEK